MIAISSHYLQKAYEPLQKTVTNPEIVLQKQSFHMKNNLVEIYFTFHIQLIVKQ